MLWREFVIYRDRATAGIEDIDLRLTEFKERAMSRVKDTDKNLQAAREIVDRLDTKFVGYLVEVQKLQQDQLIKAAKFAFETATSMAEGATQLFVALCEPFQLARDTADLVSGETLDRIIGVASYGVSLGAAVAGGPWAVVALLVGGAKAADDVRNILRGDSGRRERLVRHRQDEEVRKVLEAAINTIRSFPGLLQRAEEPLDAVFGGLSEAIRTHHDRAVEVERVHLSSGV